MAQSRRMRIAVLAMICTAAFTSNALAAGPQALSTADAQRYAAAFEAADSGDFIEAEMKAAEVKDKSLLGVLSFRQLMHPTAHRASFEELSAWLARYRDLPLAGRIFALAAKRKPADAAPPPAPLIADADWAAAPQPAQRLARPSTERGRQAREAFYAGDVRRALDLAPGAGEVWIAGLAAYRLKDYATAQTYFQQVSRDESEDAWLRSGAAFWASRAAAALGDMVLSASHMRLAAQFPDTFYGMIAERQARLRPSTQANAGRGELLLASFDAPSADLARFIAGNARAHRAAALAQVGRPAEAGLELRAGLTLAATEAERRDWSNLIVALNAPIGEALETAQAQTRRALALGDYPAPSLEPKWGFTLDKALVYAIVRQESRFNPAALSPAGAVGLMQLMPAAAARAAGDDKLLQDTSPLLDPAFNLRVGQDYFTWLMERGVGYDLLRAVAAYNGGPGMLQKTAGQLGDDATDSLLLIECLPALETRNYVEKVMAAYWTYRRMFGQDSRTLDALATGATVADARLEAIPAKVGS